MTQSEILNDARELHFYSSEDSLGRIVAAAYIEQSEILRVLRARKIVTGEALRKARAKARRNLKARAVKQAEREADEDARAEVARMMDKDE